MAIDWTNPYKDRRGGWLRGNLHTHSGEGMTQRQILSRYAELGYDFLCISDHRKLTVPRAPKGNKLILLTGFEWNSRTGEHMNLISFDRPTLRESARSMDQRAVLRRVAPKPVLVVLNHPDWQVPEHYTAEELMERKAAHGIEVYNGLIDVLAGEALSTGKWDYLLSHGRKALGFANDDAHQLSHIGNAWNVVRAPARTARAVFDAILQGNFYCSTGVSFTDIRREGDRVEVASDNADEVWAIGEYGVRLARVYAGRMVFDFGACRSSHAKYVRFVAYGRGAAQAWTQPFFREKPVDDKWFSPFVGHWRISRLLPASQWATAAPPSPDAPLGWRPMQALDRPPGFVNVSSRYGKGNGVVYLHSRLSTPKAGTWVVALGHDGGARLFVDGRPVIDQPVRINPAAPDRSKAEVSLARGVHDLVVALNTDHGLGQGVFVRFVVPESWRGKMQRPFFPKPVEL